jgi:hypothetical protein
MTEPVLPAGVRAEMKVGGNSRLVSGPGTFGLAATCPAGG